MKKIMFIALMLISCGGELGDYGRTADDGRPANDGDMVYYGDSITAICDPGPINRSVPGFTTIDVLEKVIYYDGKDGEARYTILIGINDILKGVDDKFIYRMNRILGYLVGKDVTIISILPTVYAVVNAKVDMHNAELKALAEHFGMKYRDANSEILYEHLLDGVHLNDKGCEVLYGN